MSAGSHGSRQLSSGEEPLSVEDRYQWWKEAGGWQLRQLLFWRWDPIGSELALALAVAYRLKAEPASGSARRWSPAISSRSCA